MNIEKMFGQIVTCYRDPNLNSPCSTVWKFQDFCITEILREINIKDSRSAKSAAFAILRAVNFVDLVNFSLQKAQKFIKNQNLEPLNVLK